MGCYWGSDWYEVQHPEIDKCGIIAIARYPDAYPDKDNLGNETCHSTPPIIDGFTFIRHNNKQDAQYAAKLKILSLANEQIFNSTCTIASYENDIAELKFRLKARQEKPLDEEQKLRNIQLSNETILEEKAKLSAAKKHRNARVREWLEAELT